jgi:MFS family permease
VLFSMIPAALAVVVLAFGATDVPAGRDTSARPRLSLVGFDRHFRYFLVIVALFTLGNSSDAFLILRAQDAGLSVPGVLGMMITFNLVYALVSSPAGSLSDRVGRRRMLIAGWLLYAAVYYGFARITAGWQAWAWMGVYGIYYGLTEGTARAYVADLVPAERRGTAFGVYHAAIGLMAFPASLLAGVLWQGIGPWGGLGPWAPFALGATLALLAALLLARLRGPATAQEVGLG